MTVETLCEALERGEPVKPRSFGSFNIRSKRGRVGRNPQDRRGSADHPAQGRDLQAVARARRSGQWRDHRRRGRVSASGFFSLLWTPVSGRQGKAALPHQPDPMAGDRRGRYAPQVDLPARFYIEPHATGGNGGGSGKSCRSFAILYSGNALRDRVALSQAPNNPIDRVALWLPERRPCGESRLK